MKRLHFEVGHGLETSALSEDECNGDGPVKKFRSNVLRLSHEFFPDLQETDLRILDKACNYAHCSEEFFLVNVNTRSGWLRTVIGHAQIDRDMTYWTKAESNEFDSDIIIHSNILPYEPHWSKLREWSGIDIGIRQSEGGAWTSRKEMKAADGNDNYKRRLAKGDGSGVWQITLKGGQFVGKTGYGECIQAELLILNQIKAHPHIVYCFDHPCDEARELCEETICPACVDEETTQLCEACEKSRISAFFMEYMASDLKSFMIERIRMVDDKPPFEPEDAVDILLQIAKAMKHIHDKEVVHCDVKPANILICEIPTGDDGKQYLVKVTDFGSAKQVICTPPFKAGNGTTAYTSPEVLKQRKDRTFPIEIPRGIDVYSFGIMAFEVLTGNMGHISESTSKPSTFKAGVLKGTRPPIRKLTKDIDEGLISLVEKCWHEIPIERPSFKKVYEELDGMRGAQRDAVERGDNPAKQAKLPNGSASVCDQMMEEASALVHVGARTKKASAISKAFQSVKGVASISKIKTKVKNIGRRNPGVKVIDQDEHSS